jgi:hypothetical protein
MSNQPKQTSTLRKALTFIIVGGLVVGAILFAYFGLGIENPAAIAKEIPILTSSNADSLLGGPLQENPPVPVLITVCSGVSCDRQLPVVEEVIGKFYPKVKFLQYQPIAQSTDPFDQGMNKLAGDTLPVEMLVLSVNDFTNGPAVLNGYQTADDLASWITQHTASSLRQTLTDIKTVSASVFADQFAKETAVPGKEVMVVVCTYTSPLCVQQLSVANQLVPQAKQNGIDFEVLFVDMSDPAAAQAVSPLLTSVQFPQPLQIAEPFTVVKSGKALAGINGVLDAQTMGTVVQAVYANSSTGFPQPTITPTPGPATGSSGK